MTIGRPRIVDRRKERANKILLKWKELKNSFLSAERDVIKNSGNNIEAGIRFRHVLREFRNLLNEFIIETAERDKETVENRRLNREFEKYQLEHSYEMEKK